MISTVDPERRHGHKTSARGFDGYKGHIAVDPDSEIITATGATPGNSGEPRSLRACSATCSPGAGHAPRARTAARQRPCVGPRASRPFYGDAAYGSGEL